MQHRRVGRKLHRVKRQKMALMRSLVREIILHTSIVTTEAKAKELRPRIERLVTKARKGTLANRRAIISLIGKEASIIMNKEIIPAVGSRTSGFVRIIKKAVRKSDASRMVFIQFVDFAK